MSTIRSIPRLSLRRERWETPDADFIDVDFSESGTSGEPRPDRPTVLILHGLESGSRARPVLGFLAAVAKRGWRAAAVNFRSCSGEPNRLARAYHGGDTTDLAWAVERLTAQAPRAPLACIGLSLGGNILLKYLGERGTAVPSSLKAAAAVSAPADLAASARIFEQGRANRFYMRRLVRSLKRKTQAKLVRHPALISPERLDAIRTIADFDDAVTAPIHGFRNAEHYWKSASCGPLLASIRIPTLLINAKDDPLVPSWAIQQRAAEQNSRLTADITEQGGHLGFIAGGYPGATTRWAEERVIAFLDVEIASFAV